MKIELDPKFRTHPLRRALYAWTLRAASNVDDALYVLTGGRTDSPAAWLVLTAPRFTPHRMKNS